MDTSNDAGKEKKETLLKEVLKYALFALIIVLPVRTWIAQPFVVNGGSMDDTFKDGQYLIVDEISYRFKSPERGDVLIFRYPEDTSKYFIKRLIGLPGETVIVKNDSVTIENAEYPAGIALNEPYTGSRTLGNTSVTLGTDEYFVMGDNRIVSLDSRAWGALPKSDIIGRPVLRLLPFGKMGTFPGAVASSSMIGGTTAPAQ
ncbi:MAG: signal peptidase I [Candidatus Paceibacterota bacterium]|jgi:signal peptidase I